MAHHQDKISGVLSCFDRVIITGTLPGIAHAWYDKPKQQAHLKSTPGKCLNYYVYFIDEQFGLCYVRGLTWALFRLQVYYNGHAW